MKRILLLCMSIMLICSCARDESGVRNTSQGRSYRVYNEQIGGHDYLVFTISGGSGDGISAIHSESCHCKKK